MKILTLTDIHQNEEAARAAWAMESPDLVLDCGDHNQLANLFGTTPHFYIRGNHEPRVISHKTNDALYRPVSLMATSLPLHIETAQSHSQVSMGIMAQNRRYTK